MRSPTAKPFVSQVYSMNEFELSNNKIMSDFITFNSRPINSDVAHTHNHYYYRNQFTLRSAQKFDSKIIKMLGRHAWD